MPRKPATDNENVVNVEGEEQLSEWLGFVLTYLSDETLEEIDVEYILDHTDGLRDWWEDYQENNRKTIEEEIKKSLGQLSLAELKNLQERISEM